MLNSTSASLLACGRELEGLIAGTSEYMKVPRRRTKGLSGKPDEVGTKEDKAMSKRMRQLICVLCQTQRSYIPVYLTLMIK